jgi:alanine racemase
VARFPGVRTSIGNSAGWLNGIQVDLARPGIGLYGGNPFSGRSNPLQPVAALQGRVLQIHTVRPGESVGYSASWVAEAETRVAAIGLGYADGLPRHLSGTGEMALEDGRRCSILGRVSMDTTMIDVSAAPEVSLGDWVECFGANLDVDEVADRAGTLGYELLTRVGSRVPRVPGPLR